MFEKNHQRLIDACYPPKTKDATALPSAVSNAVSTLTFYSAGRPKKLPKVSEAILQRAHAADAHGSRGLASLAVSVDVMKALVSEARQELGCFAAEALEVAALGLKHSNNLDAFARAASLFHSVVVLSVGSSLALSDSTGRQYIQCLTTLADTAKQSKADKRLNWLALSALDGVARSEWLYATEYHAQFSRLGPALLANCLDIPVEELRQNFTFADAQSTSQQHPAPLKNRKSPSFSPPQSAPTPLDLAKLAVSSLRTVSSLSHGDQLLVKLNVIAAWLDKHDAGKAWSNAPFIEWIGTSSVNATATQYRAAVVGWWAEQTGQIPSDQQPPTPKATALLATLSTILRSATNLVGLGVGTILSQLTSVLIKREGLTAADPLGPAVLSAIAALGSHIYYFDQINDIVSDLIEALRAVGRGGGAAVNFDGEQRARVMRLLVGAMVLVLEEARQISKESGAPSPAGSPSTDGAERPPLESQGTVRGNGVLINGSAQGLRSKKEAANGGANQNGGRRNRVSPEVFQESLFLLTDIDPTLRTDYARALISYILHEMAFATEAPAADEPSMDPSHEVSRFLQELHGAAYELATSTNLGSSKLGGDASPLGPHSGDSTPAQATSAVKIQLQNELQSSRRGSVVDAEPIAATPADYIILSELLEAVQTKGSALGLLSGLPMLLALYQDAPRWESEANADQANVRISACRVVAAGGVASASHTWNVVEVHQVAEETKAAVAESPRGATLPAGIIVDGFAACTALQAASGLDQLGLASTLGTPWTRDGSSRARSLLRNPYLHLSSPGGGTRSVSNVSSTLRLATPSDPHGSRTFRAPSLADLQSSLGASTSSRTSAAPSIASTSGTMNTYATSRRTARGAAKSVLDRLERLGVSPSASSSRLSVSGIEPPYGGPSARETVA